MSERAVRALSEAPIVAGEGTGSADKPGASGGRRALRMAASIAAGAVVALAGGLILGEYTFYGSGIPWLAMSGGLGLGAAVAWIVNKLWRAAPPLRLAPLAAILATAGEVLAVSRDAAPYGWHSWRPYAWVAIVLAAVSAAWFVATAHGRVRPRRRRGAEETAPGSGTPS